MLPSERAATLVQAPRRNRAVGKLSSGARFGTVGAAEPARVAANAQKLNSTTVEVEWTL
jgi:hypothetical protein